MKLRMRSAAHACASQPGVALMLGIAIAIGPAARAEPNEDRAATGVEAADIIDESGLRDRGAQDLATALQMYGAAPFGLSTEPYVILDGVSGRRWILLVDDMRLLRAPGAQPYATGATLPLLSPGHLSMTHGPTPSAAGDGGLAGRLSLHSVRAPHWGASAYSEVRVGTTTQGTAAVQASTRSGALSADVTAVQTGQYEAALETNPAHRIVQRRAAARAAVAAELGPRAHVQFLGWLEDLDQATGGDERRQAFVLRSEMEMHPGHRLRFMAMRQDVTQTGEGFTNVHVGETQVQARYSGEFVVGHDVELTLSGLAENGRAVEPGVDVAGTRAAAGVMLQDDWRIRSTLVLRGRAGVELDGAYGPMPSGRVDVRYEPAAGLVLRGAVGTTQRAPTISERAYDTPGVLALAETAPQRLRVERSQGARVGVGYEADDDAYVRLALFWTELLDRIEPVAGASSHLRGRLTRFHNTGRGEFAGVAVDAVARELVGGLGFTAGYQWLPQAWDERAERRLPDRLQHCGRLRTTWTRGSWGSHAFVEAGLQLGSIGSGPLDPSAMVIGGVTQRVLDVLELGLAATGVFGARPLEHPGTARGVLRLSLRLAPGLW